MQELNKAYLNKFEFKSLYLEITSKCNGKCSYCYNNSSLLGEHIAYDKIVDIVNQAYTINPRSSFVLSGGEPLLHPFFLDILNLLHEHNSDVTVVTNASLLNSPVINKALQKCNIQVTLESLIQKEHDSIRGVSSFENIKNLQNNIPNLYNLQRILRVNLMKKNMMHIKEFAEFAIANRYNILSLGFLVNQGRGRNSAEIIDYEDDYNIWHNALKEIKDITILYEGELIVERKNCYPRVECELTHFEKPSMAVRVDAKGNVFPCLYFYDPQHSMGNIYEQSLRNILKGDRFLALLNSLFYREKNIKSCKQCIWDKHCRKGCPALAYSKHLTINEKESCAFLKDIFENAIKSEKQRSKEYWR